MSTATTGKKMTEARRADLEQWLKTVEAKAEMHRRRAKEYERVARKVRARLGMKTT